MKNARNINSGHEAIRDQFTCIVNLPKELYLIDVTADLRAIDRLYTGCTITLTKN